MRKLDPNSTSTLVVGLAIVAALGALWLVVWWLSEPLQLRSTYTVHVGPEAPCETEAYQAACDWWGARRGDLEACTASPFAGEVVAVTWLGPERGAHGIGRGAERDQVAVRADQCETCAVVHELGHVYGLPDSIGDGPMCGDPDECTVTCRGWR